MPSGCRILAIAFCLAESSARAADIATGGELDVTISGFVGMNAFGGDLDNQREEPELSRELDFNNDTELHVVLRAQEPESGLDYGGTIEFEGDTNVLENTEKSWVFVRGGWGELRLGDEDGPVDESALGAFAIAAGTGGIDGDIIDVLAVDAVLPFTSAEATKIRYYSPDYGGLQVGVSYTPNADDGGDTLAATDAEITNWVETALVYSREWDDVSLETSAVASAGEGEDNGRVLTGYVGATVAIEDLELGAGFGREDLDGAERTYLNAGVGHLLGPVYASLTFGRVLETRGYEGVGEPWNLVLSADLELAEGLILAGDVAYFDNDLDREAREPSGGDDGVAWITRLELAF